MNHMIHIAAISQIRLDTDGRAYYRRKRAEGKKPLEAIRCLKRRISDAIYRQLLADAQPERQTLARVREGTAGRLKNPARSTCPRSSTLRISHFPDPLEMSCDNSCDNSRRSSACRGSIAVTRADARRSGSRPRGTTKPQVRGF